MPYICSCLRFFSSDFFFHFAVLRYSDMVCWRGATYSLTHAFLFRLEGGYVYVHATRVKRSEARFCLLYCVYLVIFFLQQCSYTHTQRNYSATHIRFCFSAPKNPLRRVTTVHVNRVKRSEATQCAFVSSILSCCWVAFIHVLLSASISKSVPALRPVTVVPT